MIGDLKYSFDTVVKLEGTIEMEKGTKKCTKVPRSAIPARFICFIFPMLLYWRSSEVEQSMNIPWINCSGRLWTDWANVMVSRREYAQSPNRSPWTPSFDTRRETGCPTWAYRRRNHSQK